MDATFTSVMLVLRTSARISLTTMSEWTFASRLTALSGETIANKVVHLLTITSASLIVTLLLGGFSNSNSNRTIMFLTFVTFSRLVDGKFELAVPQVDELF